MIYDTPGVSYLLLADDKSGKKKNYNCCFERYLLECLLSSGLTSYLPVAECMGYAPESILQVSFQKTPDSN